MSKDAFLFRRLKMHLSMLRTIFGGGPFLEYKFVLSTQDILVDMIGTPYFEGQVSRADPLTH